MCRGDLAAGLGELIGTTVISACGCAASPASRGPLASILGAGLVLTGRVAAVATQGWIKREELKVGGDFEVAVLHRAVHEVENN